MVDGAIIPAFCIPSALSWRSYVNARGNTVLCAECLDAYFEIEAASDGNGFFAECRSGGHTLACERFPTIEAAKRACNGVIGR